MELGRLFSADNFHDWVSLTKYILDELTNAGYDVPDDVYDTVDLWLTKDWESDVALLNDFRIVEYLIEEISRVLDWVNPHTQGYYIFKRKNGRLYPYIKRWFDWVNYNKKIVNGEERKTEYLFTIENGQEEQLFDIRGNAILTREGYFNQ